MFESETLFTSDKKESVFSSAQGFQKQEDRLSVDMWLCYSGRSCLLHKVIYCFSSFQMSRAFCRVKKKNYSVVTDSAF